MNIKHFPPEVFLEEEVRCGYKITSEMKKVWAVQLDLLQELQRVCDKYGLMIYAEGGTLIGAIRHGGYIPWDDDIDVSMFREDYDKLMEVGQKEFGGFYFLQTVYSDEHYTRRHAQLRNTETSVWSKGGKPRKCNNGIFIDIFVLDGIPSDPRSVRKYERKVWHAKQRLKIVSKFINSLPVPVYRFLRHKVPLLSDRCLFSKYEQQLRSVPVDDSWLVCTVCSRTSAPFKFKECYAESYLADFEYVKIRVMAGYDSVLRIQYGDYMIPAKEPSLHGSMVFDVRHGIGTKRRV